jgi:serpin B
MFRKIKWISWIVLAALLVSCAPGPSAAVNAQAVRSEKPRTADPQVPPEDIAELATGGANFAFDLYRALDEPGGNLFFSPYSLSIALAMTYAGARGDTAAQMAQALHFTLPPEQLHPAFNAVDQALATRKDIPGEGADGKGFRLNIVNDLWGQQDYTFQPAFLDTIATNYGAGLRLMDFIQQPEQSRLAINKYIEEQTEQRIKDLLPPDSIDTLTRLVLTNAIYFNASWLHRFSPHQTQPAPFTRLDGSQVTMQMMELPSYSYIRYAEGEGFKAAVLPYENTDLHMLLLLPDAGRFEEFEAGLTAARLESILAQLDTRSVLVRMPSFELEDAFLLKEPLSDLGMPVAFIPRQADLSGMDGTRELYISEVVHKSFVKVNESGTEAAAATAVIVAAEGMPMDLVNLDVDRPFIFLIRDQPTGTILFLGRVLDPTQN